MTGTVVWVVDGDTIHVHVGRRLLKVRYIGVNAPEIPHHLRGWVDGGARAHEVNRRLVGGREARLYLGGTWQERRPAGRSAFRERALCRTGPLSRLIPPML